MITIFNRKEVYAGFSMEECGKIRDVLAANKIKYDFKCTSSNSSGIFSSTRSRMGSFGENIEYSYSYYVYVRKDDYEQACYVINHK